MLKSLENTGSDGILKSLHYDKPTIRFLSFILNIREGLLLHLGKMLIKWHKKSPSLLMKRVNRQYLQHPKFNYITKMDQSIAPSPDFQSILCADHMFCLYISANRYGDFRRRIALFLSFPIQRTPFSRCFGKQKRLMWKTWTGSRFIGNKIYDNIEL